MKLLGLNAVRVPFRFDQLNQELPVPTPDKPSEFFTCMVGDAYPRSACTLGTCACTSGRFPFARYPRTVPSPADHNVNNTECDVSHGVFACTLA
jgi:hypothetical protein